MLVMLLVSALAAQAQDDIDLGLDDIMGDIDLSSDDDAELISYSGDVDSNAPNYVAGKPVSITHYSGNIKVHCAERDGIGARISYVITGTKESSMERYGEAIHLRSYGSASSGSVKTTVPARYSGVSNAEVELTVNLPKQTQVTVNGGRGWVQISGCEGRVKVTNKSGGVYADGALRSVNISAANGEVKADIREGTEMAGSSRISAPHGDVTLSLPMTYNGKFYAKGTSVSVDHVVSGTNSDTLVQGTIGTGTASLTITSGGVVKVSN